MPAPNRHRGFSFAEVMFAVVILGIGFIMIAAIFPVAMRQTISTADESNAAGFARDVIGTIGSTTAREDYPDTDGSMRSFAAVASSTQLFSRVVSCLINASDQRYAAVPYFCRINDDGTTRVTVVVVRREAQTVYSADDLNPTDGKLIPRNVTVNQVALASNGLWSVEIAKDAAGNFGAVAPGTFLVVLSAGTSVGGKTLRVGELQSETDASQIWSLTPDCLIEPDDDYGNVSAGVVGREPIDPNNLGAGFAGPAQDIAVFTTFIRPG